jgi:hypothetical protein
MNWITFLLLTPAALVVILIIKIVVDIRTRGGDAKVLREAVKQQFFPFAEKEGFIRAKSNHPLFTVFIRQRGNRSDIFDIQWDNYHRPIFVVNFSEVSSSATNIGSKLQMSPFDYKSLGRLQRRRGGSLDCWYQLRKPWISVLRSRELRYGPDEVVRQLIENFQELNEWWNSKTEGPHVYIW